MVRVVVVLEPIDNHPIVRTLSTRFDIDRERAHDVYRGLLMDLCTAGAESTGDLTLARPVDTEAVPDPKTLLDDALGPNSDASVLEFEPEGGVLEQLVRDDQDAVSLLIPQTPLIGRTHLDSAAMRLRRHDLVVGPTAHGGIHTLAATDPDIARIETTAPELRTVVKWAVGNGGTVDFLEPWPSMRSSEGLEGTLALLDAYETAGRAGAPYTTAALEGITDSPSSN